VRDEAKYGKMLVFAGVLPLIRARVEADLRRHGLPSERVLAAIIQLLELTLFRIGNDEYARTNKSFGLTTLRDRHAQVRGSHIRISFRGKSGSHNESDINHRRLARIVKACRDLPGYDLFQYLDEAGERHTISSTEVNAYLREITGVSSRDHRRGDHCKRFSHLGGHQPCRARAARVRTCRQRCHAQTRRRAAVERVAKHIGNTPAVCRRCYIHPEIFEGFLDGTLLATLAEKTGAYLIEEIDGMSAEEAAVAAFLRLRLGQLAEQAA
jgi:DNA topoisomerase-1